MTTEKDYAVIQGHSRYDLEKFVKGYLLEGWLCQGGVSFQVTGSKIYYCQAMVKL